MYFEDTERLITEIEMLKVVMYLMLKRRKISTTCPLLFH